MGKASDRQAGFSIIGAVVVVAVIGIIGAAGWFVYQHNRTKETNTASTTQTANQTTNQQTTTTTSNQNIVQIPELGIEITVPVAIKDLTYKVGTDTLKDGRQ